MTCSRPLRSHLSLRRLLLLAIAVGYPMRAQQLALSGRAVDEDGRAIAGVTVRAQNLGEDTTSATGEFSIRLPDSIKPGALVAVSVLPDKWVLRDYPDGHVTVRRDDMPRLTLRLALRGSQSLQMDALIRRLLEKFTTQCPENMAVPSRSADLDALVLQKAAQLGLSPSAVRQAIEDWVAHTADSTAHDRGLAAFYSGNFTGAVHEWEASAARNEADLGETYLLLGCAELSRFNFVKAVAWIHKAFGLKPTDPDVLVGMAEVCTLLPLYDGREPPEMNAVGCSDDPLKYFDDALAQLRLEAPRVYTIEAFLLVHRFVLYGLLNDPDDDEAQAELDRLMTELKQLEVAAHKQGPVDGALTSTVLGLMLMAKKDYAEAENAFERALNLAKDQALKDVVNFMIQRTLGVSYMERGMVSAAMAAYSIALASCRGLDPAWRRGFESEIHRLMAEVYIHVPAAADEPPPKDGNFKPWWARRASRVFKQVNKQQESAFKRECALAVEIADSAPGRNIKASVPAYFAATHFSI